MKRIRQDAIALLVLTSAACNVAADGADELVKRLLAPPEIHTAQGFAARLLVAPGQLYDPLVMRAHGNVIWFNDDGGEEKDRGSRLLSVSGTGDLTVLADIGKLLPTVGFDIAPASFGEFGGQVFTLAQPKVAMGGALANHVVQRVDPANAFSASIFCTLPEAGAKKISGFGLDARFGPDGTPFAGKLFVVTIYNDAIYQVTPDGRCTPFVVFDGVRYSGPTNIAFTPDGSSMLVAVSRGAFDIESLEPAAGAILRVAADGKIADTPLFEGQAKPMGMAYAPAGFGAYGGQLFFVDIGHFQVPVPMTQRINADGRVFRLTPEGKAELVVSGLLNPVGLQFVNGKLWTTDINGDFIAGKRELPDGFMLEIEAQ
jgi:hypothetical protein